MPMPVTRTDIVSVAPVRFLVVDGNTCAVNARSCVLGGRETGQGYANVLRTLARDAGYGVEITIVTPADDGAACLDRVGSWRDFDAIVWTGSALNIYDRSPEIEAQIELAVAAFESTVPVFGSCWGLQLMCVALGGEVRRNPKGREVVFGRAITKTSAGKNHPMVNGKPDIFDAITVHLDEVSRVPDGGVVLASNAMSAVQALEIRRDERTFWGVQYHPEFDFLDIAVVLRRYGKALLEEGLFATLDDVNLVVENLLTLHVDPQSIEARDHLKIDDVVASFSWRTMELNNWLQACIVPSLGAAKKDAGEKASPA